MSNDTKITPSCGNVFKDIGLPDADELFLKAQLGFKVFRIFQERQLNQKGAAELLGTNEAEIHALFHGEFSDYNTEQLFSFLNRLDYDVDVYLSPSKDGNPHQQLHAAD
jgi:predicted XRE-type DNA-binding protein